jgi:pyruvate/2-oxoacid:ferredoxin oxidoreductase beta subunit
MCAGCGGTIAVRNVLKAVKHGDKAVIGNATGCLEVSSFMYLTRLIRIVYSITRLRMRAQPQRR